MISFSRFIDFASVTSNDLDHLLAACRLTTSGHGKKDVHGESQCQVLKMDAPDFIVRSDIVDSDLMRAIEDKLLQGKTDNKCIRVEPVRLDIYGKYCPEPSPIMSLYLKLAHLPRQGFVLWGT